MSRRLVRLQHLLWARSPRPPQWHAPTSIRRDTKKVITKLVFLFSSPATSLSQNSQEIKATLPSVLQCYLSTHRHMLLRQWFRRPIPVCRSRDPQVRGVVPHWWEFWVVGRQTTGLDQERFGSPDDNRTRAPEEPILSRAGLASERVP